MLNLLWSAWSDFGAAGYSAGTFNKVLDLEAMILTTCFWGRYDQRLFDEMLSWLVANERLVNIQRLRTILSKEQFQESRLIAPICKKLNKKNRTPKWQGLERKLKSHIKTEQSEKVFMFSNNTPLPIPKKIDEDFSDYGFLRSPFIDRKLAGTFQVSKTSTLQLQLRAFFGVCSRAEVMLALIINNRANISEIAEGSYFSWKSTQDSLFEMSLSGVVSHSPPKRERFYYLVSDAWHKIFPSLEKPPQGFNFCKFFSAMEILWQKTSTLFFGNLSEKSVDLEIADLIDDRLAILLSAADLSCRIPLFSENHDNYFEKISNCILKQIDQLFR
jgi:hypothetical protein